MQCGGGGGGGWWEGIHGIKVCRCGWVQAAQKEAGAVGSSLGIQLIPTNLSACCLDSHREHPKRAEPAPINTAI